MTKPVSVKGGSALSAEVMDDFARIWRAWKSGNPEDLEATPGALNRIQFAFEKLMTERDALKGALHSTQDTLLYKVPRTQTVREQLEINRNALVRSREPE